MARISTYPIDTKISGGDKWIGTDVDKNNATKNFTVANVAEYLNVSSSIDSQTLRYKFQYLSPGGVREPGTISFNPQLGSSVPFSSVTTWLLSQYSKKYVSQGAANDISSFYTSPLIGSQVLVTNTKDISKWAVYTWTSSTVDSTEKQFYNIGLTHVSSTGSLEANQEYFISLLTLSGGGGGKQPTYVFTQGVPATTWTIPHNLGNFPSVSVVDSTKRVVNGTIDYIDDNNLTVTFGAPFSGQAFLN